MYKRRSPVSRMSDADLLSELCGFQNWAFDNFSMSEPTRYDHQRAGRVRSEILRRMAESMTNRHETIEDEGQKRQNNAARELLGIPEVQKRLAENDTAIWEEDSPEALKADISTLYQLSCDLANEIEKLRTLVRDLFDRPEDCDVRARAQEALKNV
jgi:hypothetical protein